MPGIIFELSRTSQVPRITILHTVRLTKNENDI